MKYSPLLALLALVHGSLLSRQGTRVDNGGHSAAPQSAFVQIGTSQRQLPMSRPQLPGEVPQVPAAFPFSDQLPALPGMPTPAQWSPQPGYSLPQVPMQSIPGLPALGPNFEVPGPVADVGDGLPPLPPLPELPPLPSDMQNPQSFIQPAAQQPPMNAIQSPMLPAMKQNSLPQQVPRAPVMAKVVQQSATLIGAGSLAAAAQQQQQQQQQPNQQLPQQRQSEQPVNSKPTPPMQEMLRQPLATQSPGHSQNPQSTKGRTFLGNQAAIGKEQVAPKPIVKSPPLQHAKSDIKTSSGGAANFLAHDQQLQQVSPVQQQRAAPPVMQQQPSLPARPNILSSPAPQEPLEVKTALAATQMDQISQAPLPSLDSLVGQTQLATQNPIQMGNLYGQNFQVSSAPAFAMQPMTQNATAGAYQNIPNLGYGGPQGLPMFGQLQLGGVRAPFPAYSNFGPVVGGPSRMQLNALQMPAMQNQMVAAIQAQYNAQLAQYNEQQKQFKDWAKKYEQYEQNLAFEQQQYQLQEQQYQSFAQQQRQIARSPHAALVQTGARSESAREATLASRERALAARGKALAGRETALRQETEKVRAEEAREVQEKQSLDARQSTLAQKEKQVQVLENELIQEQRKIWKVLQNRQVAAPPTENSARPVPVNMAAQRGRKSARLALTQTGTATKARVRRATRSQIKLASSTASHRVSNVNTVARAKTSAGSDVHVVTAAKVAPDFDDEDAPLPETSKASEDDSAGTNDNGNAATADNDDLEQILLQQSSSVRGNGDPVESA